MTKDFAEFLDALNRHGVRYVVIGGIAVLSHCDAHPRNRPRSSGVGSQQVSCLPNQR
jgi:hypothetical protein